MSSSNYGTYDFDLTAAQEERARALHEASTIVDLIWWGPVTAAGYTDSMNQQLREGFATHHDVSRLTRESQQLPARLAAAGGFDTYQQHWDECGVTVGHWEIQIGDPRLLLEDAAFLHQLFDGVPWLTKVLRAQDFRTTKSTGGHGLYLQCQPTPSISTDLSLLTMAHEIGLRTLQLTYNVLDHVGGGCTDRTGAGLSDFGVDLVRRLNELGIIVDGSHCSPRTIADACAVSERPVIVSHSGAKSLFPHDRCISDESAELVARTGGLVGVVAVPFFLNSGAATMDDLLNHVDHLVGVVGWEHVAIGTDWPLGAPDWVLVEFEKWVFAHGFKPEHGVRTTQNLVGFDDYRDFPNITRGLVARGYSNEQIQGILGENFIRVFADVCG